MCGGKSYGSYRGLTFIASASLLMMGGEINAVRR